MVEIINLNKARKAKARGDREAQAVENRARFGRTKAEKDRGRIERQRAEQALDGAKREE